MKNQIYCYILVFLFLFSNTTIIAQPTIQWQKCLGGSDDEVARSVRQTADGGYIIAGYSNSNNGDLNGNHGGFDCWVVKMDTVGSIQWQKCLGGSDDDYATSIEQTTDGGYIVGGGTKSNDGDATGNHGGTDYWIVKLDTAGNIQWQNCLGGTDDDGACSLQQTAEGGYIVSGFSMSNDGNVTVNHGLGDYWVVKLDTAGSIQWQKCLGGSKLESAYSIQQATDGGYIAAGYSESDDGDVTGHHYPLTDYWVVKLDDSGNIQWKKCLGGSSNDYARSIQQTTDGGYIVAGWAWSIDGDVTGNHTGGDYWVVKLDASGNIQWQKCLGGGCNDFAYSIQQTADGGYIVAGHSSSYDGDVTGIHTVVDYWVVKLDTAGFIQWQKCLGGSSVDKAYSIQQTADGGYIVAGETGSNDIEVTGYHGGSNDYWVVKLKPFIVPVDTTIVPIDTAYSIFPVYVPNVFSPNEDGINDLFYVRSTFVKEFNLKVYDRWGNRVFDNSDINTGWDGRDKNRDCSEGVYYYVAKITFDNGEPVIKKGNVTLVR